MMLTAEIIRASKPKEKRYAIADGRGLLLEIQPTGTKSWVVRYYIKNKEHRKHIGQYPDMNISEAREKNAQIKAQAKSGKEINSKPQQVNTFRHLAESYLSVRLIDKSEIYQEKTKEQLKHLYKAIGDMGINEIRPRHILARCRELEAEGKTSTAHRIRELACRVYSFGVSCDLAETNPASELYGALKSHHKKHYATLTKPEDIEELVKAIDDYTGSEVVRLALFFSALTFCRPGEIRYAEWSEIDWNEQLWKIPAEKMKMKRQHIIPLSCWTMDILNMLEHIQYKEGWKGGNRYIFPSQSRDGKPMRENTISIALKKMEFAKRITPHGFRGMASTQLNEQGHRSDLVECQLAHGDTDKIREAYNHAEYLEQRREMMQWWSDYLYSCRNPNRAKIEDMQFQTIRNRRLSEDEED